MAIRRKSAINFFAIGAWILIGTMAVLIISPVAFLIYGSLNVSDLGEPPVFNISNYVRAFSSSETITLTINTISYAFGSSFLAIALATGLAVITTRTNTPFRVFFRFMPLMNLIAPAFVTTIGWLYLLSPQTGLINTFFMKLDAPGPLLNMSTSP